MPFPLGILYLKNHKNGAIGWAWGINGLFTVVGGGLSVVLSLAVGFTYTFMLAIEFSISFIMPFASSGPILISLMVSFMDSLSI